MAYALGNPQEVKQIKALGEGILSGLSVVIMESIRQAHAEVRGKGVALENKHTDSDFRRQRQPFLLPPRRARELSVATS